MQHLLTAGFGIGIGGRMLTAATPTGVTAILLLPVGGMPITHQGLASTVGTMKDDRDHSRFLLFIWNWSSQSTTSFSLVPLPTSLALPGSNSTFAQPTN